jgi:hypothetical protein
VSDRRSFRVVSSRREPILGAGGDGPYNPDMEVRLTRLEGDCQAMRADLSATRADTAYIRGRVESLPTTWQMIGTVMAGNVALVGMMIGAILGLWKFLGH